MSVVSFRCILKGKGEATNSSMTCFKMLKEISNILERITSFDMGIAYSFLFCSSPQTSSTISNAYGFTNVSPIVWGFFCLALRYETLKDVQEKLFVKL
jgi:hypothetical protein